MCGCARVCFLGFLALEGGGQEACPAVYVAGWGGSSTTTALWSELPRLYVRHQVSAGTTEAQIGGGGGMPRVPRMQASLILILQPLQSNF